MEFDAAIDSVFDRRCNALRLLTPYKTMHLTALLKMKPLITIYYEENGNSTIANMTVIQRANAEAEAEVKHPKFRIKLLTI